MGEEINSTTGDNNYTCENAATSCVIPVGNVIKTGNENPSTDKAYTRYDA